MCIFTYIYYKFALSYKKFKEEFLKIKENNSIFEKHIFFQCKKFYKEMSILVEKQKLIKICTMLDFVACS